MSRYNKNDDEFTTKLKHRITILKRSTGRNEYGENTEEWVGCASFRSAADPLLGKEYFAAEAIQSRVEIKFRARWRSGIDRTMRVRFKGVDYEILDAINVKELNRELLIYASKVVL